MLVEAAADGALLVEVMFGASHLLRDDFLDRFAASLAEVRHRFPQFHAVPLVVAATTAEWAATLLPRCLAAARRGLACTTIAREYAIAAELGFSSMELRGFEPAPPSGASFCDPAERDRLLPLID